MNDLIPDTNIIRSAARQAVSELAKRQVKDAQPLISSGMIDSLSILRLIAMLETQLKVAIPTETTQPDDFDTVDLIVETVERVAQ